MRGVQLYYLVLAIVVSALALMMIVDWQRAPRGIREMSRRLGKARVPAGVALIAIAAVLVFGQNL